jgi:VanZ family protein
MSEHTHSRLAHYLALVYLFVIIYASLQPFMGWHAPEKGTPFFLWDKWPQYITRFDLIINVLAYIPMGFLLTSILRRKFIVPTAITAASVSCFFLSLTMESIQMYLPNRISSNLDLICNTLGGVVGAVLSIEFARHVTWHNWFYQLRYRLFLPGRKIDLGLALITLWFLAQLNPAIPLFGGTFSNLQSAPPSDSPNVLLEAAKVFLNLMGIGLFVIILLQLKQHARPIITLLLIVVLIVKGFAATTMLKVSALHQWVSLGVVFGLVAGFLFLLALAHLRSSIQVYICSICLLSSAGITLLTIRAQGVLGPAQQFNWSYGHLLNFNGLTHTISLIWPLAAVLYLLTFAKIDRDNN